MIDIAREYLYVGAMHQVIESSLKYRPRPLAVNGRGNDGLIFILSGGCTYSFRDGKELIASAGDILYLPANAYYRMYLHRELYRYIYFDFDFISDEERSPLCCAPQNAGETEACFRRLLREFRKFREGGFAVCLSLVYQIYDALRSAVTGAYVGRSATERMNESLNLLKSQFADDSLSVGLLAEKAGMSETHYRKLFRALFHDSPSRYLTAVRLQAAEAYMKYPFLSLEECARKSGFSSLQYFCRVFKKNRGISPARWRREEKQTAAQP